MPGEIRAAVEWAEADEEVHVIVVEGEGRAFCAGYDLVVLAEDSAARRPGSTIRCSRKSSPGIRWSTTRS